jgi:hypothetical protein
VGVVGRGVCLEGVTAGSWCVCALVSNVNVRVCAVPPSPCSRSAARSRLRPCLRPRPPVCAPVSGQRGCGTDLRRVHLRPDPRFHDLLWRCGGFCRGAHGRQGMSCGVPAGWAAFVSPPSPPPLRVRVGGVGSQFPCPSPHFPPLSNPHPIARALCSLPPTACW